MKIRMAHRAALAVFVIVVLSAMLAGCDGIPPTERIERAQAFIDQKRPRGAVIELKIVLQEEPDNGQARRLLGSAFLMLGALEDAENQLTRALRLGADSPDVITELGEVWRHQQRHRKIIREIEPNDDWPRVDRIQALILRANAFLSLAEYSPARRAFEDVLALQPENVQAVVGLVHVQQNTKDDIELKGAVDAALEIAPDHPRLLGLSADLAFKSGEYGKALALFQRQKTLSPDNILARVGLAQALMATDRLDDASAELNEVLGRWPKHPQALYLLTILDARKGDYAVASIHGKSALRTLPYHQPTMFLVGLSSYGSGRWKEARWNLENLLRLNPDHEAAQLLLRATNERIAEQSKHRAVAQKPNLPLAEHMRSFGLLDNDFEPASTGGAEAGTVGEQTARSSFLARGHEALVAGNDSQAVEAFGRALARHVDRVTVRSLALAHDRAGHAADGRRVLERWLIDHVDDVETRTILANLYLADDDYDEALAHLEILVKARPMDFAVLNNLAWSYVRQGDPREALPLAERAYALAGSDPRIMDTLGWVLVQIGNSERAIPLLERAAYGESGSSETLLHLAQAHFENDDLTSARAVLKTIKRARDAAKVQYAADALLRAIDR